MAAIGLGNRLGVGRQLQTVGAAAESALPGNQDREFGTGKGKALMTIRDGASLACLLTNLIQSAMPSVQYQRRYRLEVGNWVGN